MASQSHDPIKLTWCDKYSGHFRHFLLNATPNSIIEASLLARSQALRAVDRMLIELVMLTASRSRRAMKETSPAACCA